MASNFSSLRSSRKSLLDKLAQEAKKDQKQGADERFWKLTVDPKTKIGFATIRFLPAPKGEELPWVRVWSHGFQIGGSWYIENCPTTLGGNRPCPVCKDNHKLWTSGLDSDKEIARGRKRKLSYICNILVLSDPVHPENDGKVFLYRYGPKIQDKIMELIEPQFPDQAPANPFDLWEGCDFKLKSQKKDGFQNYDKSSFADPSELFEGDDEKKEEMWLNARPLSEFVQENQFKSYEDLEKRFQQVLTGTAGAARTAEEAATKSNPSLEDAEDAAREVQKEEKPARAAAARKPAASAKPKPAPAEEAPEDEDDIKNFFAGGLGDED